MADLSPLRQRMIEDMKVRNLSPATQRCYVHAVAKFAHHFNRCLTGWAWRKSGPIKST
jgi:integrase/recombinase XerD